MSLPPGAKQFTWPGLTSSWGPFWGSCYGGAASPPPPPGAGVPLCPDGRGGA